MPLDSVPLISSKQFYVYHIINTYNNKRYVGVSVENINRCWGRRLWCLRKKEHYNSILQNAWNKYGEKCFKFEIFAIYYTKEDMLNTEISEITYWKSLGLCYNIKHGGDGGGSVVSRICSEETKKKLSIANKGQKRTEEFSKKRLQYFIDNKISDETRLRMSESQKGRIVSLETREKLKQANLGKKLSEEHRLKMSESAKNRPPISEETREKMILAQANKKLSEEHKRKLGLVHKDKPWSQARRDAYNKRRIDKNAL
jgi:group I intron endonuclease